MAFLKRHGFYIALILALVAIVGSAWGLFIHPRDSKSRAEVKSRVMIYKQIEGLGSTGRNEGQVEAIKEYVETVKAEYDKMKEAVARMNQRGRTSLVVTAATGESFPVFPVDKDKHDAHDVPTRFRQLYREAMDALFEELSATTPPTQPEIASAVRQMLNYLAEEARHDDDRTAIVLPAGVTALTGPASAGQGATGAYAVDAGMGMGGMGTGMGMGGMGMGGMGMGGMGMGVPGAGTGTDRPDSAVSQLQAQQQALGNLQILRTTDPTTPVYAVQSESFCYHPLPATVGAAPAEMWKANLNYWLHKYVVSTIQRTNTEHARRRRVPATIANNVVKRLVGIQIGTISGSAGGEQKTILYEGEAEPVADAADGGGAGEMGGFGMGMMDSAIYGAADATGEAREEETLTGRTCTQEYDVVNFQLAAVVASDQLEAFLLNLVNDGFYTIQKVNLYDANAIPGMSMRSGTSNRIFGEEEYYYGGEPVVKVVISLEALLFTRWERDLMPVEMLKRLPVEALRPADEQRLAQHEQEVGETAQPVTGANTYDYY